MCLNTSNTHLFDKSFWADKEDLSIALRHKMIGQIYRLSIELERCLSGSTHQELDCKDVEETDEHRLKIVKGMSNRELDSQTFQASRLHEVIGDYLEKLRLEVDKRARYGIIPIDGADWETPIDGRPSIGPMIEPLEEDIGDG